MRAWMVPLVIALGAARLDAQWQAVVPGGDTLCADGSPYRFFVYPGDPGKLLLEFEGGGACWDDATCATSIYTRNVTLDPAAVERSGQLVGIYDRTNPDNPFRDWMHVYVPYCTGDLHWGANDRTYAGFTGPYVVHHRGAVNAAAAVSWAYENVPAPRQLFVAGCSAGGYGALLWSAQVMGHYSGAAAAQFSDSAAGVVPPGFFVIPLANWGVAAAWPSFIPSLSLDRLDASRVTMADVYGGVAGFYPLSAFSQFNRLADATQVFFYILTKGALAPPEEWAAQMQASMVSIEAANPNFFGYIAPGSDHCVINSAALYTTQVGGVRLVDWLRKLSDTRAPGSVP
ncbi:MAG: esterase [Acidobacteria bacterium]|nr:MAG: esterase [Acidobacteriota bacterium]